MNLKYFFPIVIFILLIIFIYSFLDETTQQETYFEEIDSSRTEILNYMRNNPDSPFRIIGDSLVAGIQFFDIDPEFRVKAKIDKIASPVPLQIRMSDGSYAEYFKYAMAKFSLKGVNQELYLLKSKQFYDDPWLFLPFYDETSADETYGGGRYLNVEYHGEKETYLDFNLAYNPYCAYSEKYSCPIPPVENHITVQVTAGERDFKGHH